MMNNLYNNDAATTAAGSSYSTLSAFFDSRSDAEGAIERLKAAVIPSADIRLVPGNDGASISDDGDSRGFWEILEDFFFPHDDRAAYAEGLRRGGYLVSVSNLSTSFYGTAHNILDDEGSIDIDERAGQWRSEGWDSGNATAASSGALGQATTARADTLATGQDETIQVVEENLRVGKRDVNNGSVRVRAYTVKQPVREDVTLGEENVSIERRTVDRPLSDVDRAFQDRTITAEEHHEEAVVAKDARVVEEIGMRKTASDRTETIADSVRKTEVEVEDERTSTGRTQTQGLRRD
jgi:uncharacterized protein (TIGR02271 family)